MSIQAASKVRMNLDALTYAHGLWESMDTPVSLSCALLAKYEEYETLVGKTIDPRDYSDPLRFFQDYQSVKILSKYPYLKTGIDTKKVAMGKFEEAESSCRRTNVRWRLREDGHCFSARVERVISRAQRKISLVLGEVPDFEQLDFAFGPGAAFGVRGETSVFNKVTSPLECTYAFADILGEFLPEFPSWIPSGSNDVHLVRGSQLTFVPKDAKTDRPICIEPLLNGLYQKGFGSYIRDRLHRYGINLRDQSVNQKLASRAHLDGLATVDFSSASDTISYRLVLDLLPWEWFNALDVARCPSFLDGTVWKTFQKFTSMGNAYTFELETLIFFALASACCEEEGVRYEVGSNLSVYGDDVIIPQSVFHLFQEVGVACGFAVNLQKSFSDGVFFESCGHDYFLGTLVRPFLLTKRINTLPSAFYAANTVLRICERLPQGACREAILRRLLNLHSFVVRRIPPAFRVLGPEGYGDGHLLGELDAAMTSRCSRVTRHPSWDGWLFTSYAEESVLVRKDEWPNAYALYFTGRQNGIPSPFEKPSKVRNSAGYSIRGQVKLSKNRGFCHSSWQLPRIRPERPS